MRRRGTSTSWRRASRAATRRATPTSSPSARALHQGDFIQRGRRCSAAYKAARERARSREARERGKSSAQAASRGNSRAIRARAPASLVPGARGARVQHRAPPIDRSTSLRRAGAVRPRRLAPSTERGRQGDAGADVILGAAAAALRRRKDGSSRPRSSCTRIATLGAGARGEATGVASAAASTRAPRSTSSACASCVKPAGAGDAARGRKGGVARRERKRPPRWRQRARRRHLSVASAVSGRRSRPASPGSPRTPIARSAGTGATDASSKTSLSASTVGGRRREPAGATS